MKETRILLISFMQRLGNQGLAYVAETLETAGFNVATLTIPPATVTDRDCEAVLAFINERRPAIVGMSLMTSDFKRARELPITVPPLRS